MHSMKWEGSPSTCICSVLKSKSKIPLSHDKIAQDSESSKTGYDGNCRSEQRIVALVEESVYNCLQLRQQIRNVLIFPS